MGAVWEWGLGRDRSLEGLPRGPGRAGALRSVSELRRPEDPFWELDQGVRRWPGSSRAELRLQSVSGYPAFPTPTPVTPAPPFFL